MKYTNITIAILAIALASCGNGKGEPDAYGNFESEEVLVSAQQTGEIMSFQIDEGELIDEGAVVGLIDTVDLHLMRLEVLANIAAVKSQYSSITAQMDVLVSKKAILQRDLDRFMKMKESMAATDKQIDDLEGQLKVVNKEMATIQTQNPHVTAQLNAATAKLKQIDERCQKSIIRNPIKGRVITKIAREHELAGPGSPLYTVADLSTLDFRAYLTGSQLSSIELGQEAILAVDAEGGKLLHYKGRISWVSDEAEFTPKIIQTREERVDMVYAVKVKVENDGKLKMGMPGELYFNQGDAEGQ